MSFSTEDTIVAIATPLGRAALGVVRLSGPQAAPIAQRLTRRSEPLAPRHATFARYSDWSAADGLSDQIVCTYFPGPHSYTGDDVVEFSAHGSAVILQSLVRTAMQAGARLAQPGEFTLRAFLNGKLDLIQAEAVADLIDAVTPLQARAAFDQLEGTLTGAIREIEALLFDLIARLEASLDFPDEGYHFVDSRVVVGEIASITERIDSLLSDARRGRLLREGARIALVGTPNVGKSSLFNALVNANRAIVTSIPGTTRDLLTERADIKGIAVSLVDTAGIRDSDDIVEREGIARARQAMAIADLAVVVLDRSRPLSADDHALITTASTTPRVIVINKVDLPSAWTPMERVQGHEVSAIAGSGLDALLEVIGDALGIRSDRRDEPLVSNVRHADLLERSRSALARATDAITISNHAISEEFVLADLQEGATLLQEITGERTSADLLTYIFSRFCIGK